MEATSEKREKIWEDEARVANLKTLWAEGLSASQIAARLGPGVTRNAVIGKVHRMNLPGRATNPYGPTKPREKKKKPREPGLPTGAGTSLTIAAPRPVPLPDPRPLVVAPSNEDNGKCTILHLSDKTCKWPIGFPGEEGFCFCGHGPREGSPYCEYHSRIAYIPLQRRWYKIA